MIEEVCDRDIPCRVLLQNGWFHPKVDTLPCSPAIYLAFETAAKMLDWSA